MSNNNDFYESTEEQAVVGRIGFHVDGLCAELREACDTLQERLEELLEEGEECIDEESLLDTLIDQVAALEDVSRALLDTI